MGGKLLFNRFQGFAIVGACIQAGQDDTDGVGALLPQRTGQTIFMVAGIGDDFHHPFGDFGADIARLIEHVRYGAGGYAGEARDICDGYAFFHDIKPFKKTIAQTFRWKAKL